MEASDAGTEVLRQGLRELGYVEGRTAVIEWRWWEGKPERLRDAAAEMVRLNPDVIVVGGSEATKAMKEATRIDPDRVHWAELSGRGRIGAEFRAPGGNITGITVAQSDHAAKLRKRPGKASCPDARSARTRHRHPTVRQQFVNAARRLGG